MRPLSLRAALPSKHRIKNSAITIRKRPRLVRKVKLGVLTIPSVMRYYGVHKKQCFKTNIRLVVKCVRQRVLSGQRIGKDKGLSRVYRRVKVNTKE
jgi:hypothetical protein